MPVVLSGKGENTDLKSNLKLFRHKFCSGTVSYRIRIFILVFSCISVLYLPASSQSRAPYKTIFETNLGYGFPESICLKLRVGNDLQPGLMQAFDTRGFGPTGLEIYYRFGERPRLLDRPMWYAVGGIAGYLFDVKYTKEYKALFYPRIGRSFHFSKKVGFNIDIGPGFPFGRNGDATNLISPVVLTGNMNLFFRF